MYREEYPRPQLVRNDWVNLNGEWDFAFDDANVGLKEKWYKKSSKNFDRKIQVPFAFQTKLSGINDPSFHDIVWYKREFNVPNNWSEKRTILHFGAVDYRAWVYVNEEFVGFHEGGSVGFKFDITDYLQNGPQTLVVKVEDPSTDETIPRGKQSWEEKSKGIWYNRTSGIWQTVWLESHNDVHLSKIKMTPDIDKGNLEVEFEVSGDAIGKEVLFEVEFKGEKIVEDTVKIFEKNNRRTLNVFNQKIFRSGKHNTGWCWTPETPNLFDIKVTVREEDVVLDEIDSYFGMRKVHTENGMVYLNNCPYYQKLVLDQGYWPDGLLTAPSDDDLKLDIELTKQMGFNGCRKHQKVEDPRFLYWADKLGFLVWGECPASSVFSEEGVGRLTKEWIEIIDRDYNHPSIVTWVPINESWGVPEVAYDKQQQQHTLGMYYLIHSLDKTRPVVSNDGWEITKTDITAIHNYNHGELNQIGKYNQFIEDLETREAILSAIPHGRAIYANGYKYEGEPILLTEFGGIGFKFGNDDGWGYSFVADQEEFIKDYRRVLEAVYRSKVIYGYCYTQLTDVEQEINGLLTYGRKPKCDLEIIKEINDSWHKHTI